MDTWLYSCKILVIAAIMEFAFLLRMNSKAVSEAKEDLVAEESVPYEEAAAFAKQIGASLIRTSAKNNTGVAQMFVDIAETILLLK